MGGCVFELWHLLRLGLESLTQNIAYVAIILHLGVNFVCKGTNYMKFIWSTVVDNPLHPKSSFGICSASNARPVIKVTRSNNYARELLLWVIIQPSASYIIVDTFLCGPTAEPATIRRSAILCQQEIQRKMWRGAKSKHAPNYNYFMCGICVAYLNREARDQRRGANEQFASSPAHLNKQSAWIRFCEIRKKSNTD